MSTTELGRKLDCPHFLMAIISLHLDGDLGTEMENFPDCLRGKTLKFFLELGKLFERGGGRLAMSEVLF